MSTHRKAVLLGLLSHFCAASFPFLAKESLGSFGSYRGALLLYLVAVGISWAVVLGFGNPRTWVRAVRSMLGKREAVLTFTLMMVLATASVMLFYGGLNQAAPGEFTFVVRLEHLWALILGFVVLGERTRAVNVLGALLAFSGWLLVVNFSSVQGTPLLFALGYIVISGSATLLAKKMLRHMDDSAFYLLRMTATMLVQFVLTLTFETQALEQGAATSAGALISTALGGIVLALLFSIRYKAMSNLPLWWYSSLSATQMVFTPIFAWISGKPLTWQVLLGGAIVTIGVSLASAATHTQANTAKGT